MAKAAAPKQDVATTKQSANLPAEFYDQVAADAGRGGEDATSEDMSVPFIKIAQALSPEVNKRDAAWIDGLEVGDFFNTASQEMHKGESGMYFIPVKYLRKYLQWTPRDSGGGFGGEHDASILDQTTPGEKGENFLKNGDEIVITGTWFGIAMSLDGEVVEQAVISLAKTQLKKSKQLMTKLKSVALPKPSGKGTFNPPFFYNRVKVTSVPESNDQGNWMGWKFELAGSVFDFGEKGGELYDSAKMLLEAVDSGRAKVDEAANAPANDGGGNRDDGEQGAGQKADEKIPF